MGCVIAENDGGSLYYECLLDNQSCRKTDFVGTRNSKRKIVKLHLYVWYPNVDGLYFKISLCNFLQCFYSDKIHISTGTETLKVPMT